eukprot:c14257_g1_i1 orf=109-936(+)
MSCFLYPTSSPSPICNPNPNPNPNPTPTPTPNPNSCPEFSFKFPALERDYMGLGLGFSEHIIAASSGNSPLANSSADPSPVDDLCGSHLRLGPPSSGADDGGDADDGESLSANIGWPPISSYRKTTTRALSIKPSCNREASTPVIAPHAPLEITTNNNLNDKNDSYTVVKPSSSNLRKSLHIKVSMDGTPIMRKLDLESMQGYHHLSMELHKLFKFYKRNISCEVGIHSCFKDFSGCNFILTYKDKDGDWMLVGDTPWETFAQSARRIRIMKKVK